MTDISTQPVGVESPACGSVATFANEDLLPRVPLPSLEDTCARFLDWCAPLLTVDELDATRLAVDELLVSGGGGRVLHGALAAYDTADGVHSWLDTFWPYRYLGRRDRIALNANFFFLFEDTGQSQVERAAALVGAALAFKRLIDEEGLSPAVLRGAAQSMEQNKFLFSTTRIPGAVQDRVRAPYSPEWPGASSARHILVLYRGAMHRLDVIGAEGRPHAPAAIEAALRGILDAGEEGPSVGHLTTKARAAWAASRDALIGFHPTNAVAIETVETALFCVCLEDLVPRDRLAVSGQLLHGHSGNRWFDKAVSLIVFGDGTAGINVEHCELDGTTVLRFTDALLDPPGEPPPPAVASPPDPPALAPVPWVLDDELRADIASAGDAFAAYAADMATMSLSIDFGADRAKRLGVSPDAFVQMAYQLAHRRAKGFVGATYESIATRQYRRGRTEAMRVVTPEVVAFVAAMEDPTADPPRRAAALREAAAAHGRRARDCQEGRAPEQHLWELQLIQVRRGRELGVDEVPALYASPGWLRMRDDYLSTSSAPSPHIRSFGFGSTSSRCIGVGYILLPDRFDLYLSTPRSVAADMRSFAHHLELVLRELEDLLSDG